jgi:hypothetical protein
MDVHMFQGLWLQYLAKVYAFQEKKIYTNDNSSPTHPVFGGNAKMSGQATSRQEDFWIMQNVLHCKEQVIGNKIIKFQGILIIYTSFENVDSSGDMWHGLTTGYIF